MAAASYPVRMTDLSSAGSAARAEPPSFWQRWGGWMRAAGVVTLCAAVAEAMLQRLDLANIIMVYLAGVAYVAFHEGPRISIATVGASIFIFDLMQVPPRWGLNPLNPSHLITFAVMLAVGLLISHLAGWAREQTALAEGRARRAQAMSDFSAALALVSTEDEIATEAGRAVHGMFGVPARILPHGEAAAPGELRFPLGMQGAAGELGVRWPADRPLSAEDQVLLSAFARQAGLALDRRTFERRSAEARVQAEAERLRNTLLSGISHDFRTPLTTIVGAATSLLEQDRLLDEARRRTLTRGVLDEARRLHELVSDLLDLTRMEEGAAQLSAEWCPADDMVQEALAQLGARAARHQIEVAVPADAIVWCDPRLVEQALRNLVDNALRYTPPGSRIDVGVEVGSGEWLLRVSDNGAGFPPGMEQAVFRKFQRGQSEPAGSGFGLGLAICAAVAKLHGGRIEAQTRGGALVTMTLPQPQEPCVPPESQ
jgi:two-component system sensor histidine kinase KdpD